MTLVARRAWLLAIALVWAGTTGCSSERTPATPQPSATPVSQPPATQPLDERARASLQRGVDWLLRQQAADGGWHSAKYGQMRGGVGNTALVLEAFSWLPEPLRRGEQPAIERGLRFLITNLDAAGFVRSGEGSADYPTYATALVLSAMQRLGINEWPDERRRMQDYLRAAQQTARQGWLAGDADYGGWHHTGGTETDVKISGETNLSVTRYVLEALQATGALDDAARAAALAYLARCQNLDAERRGDGGFFFTAAQDDPRNKAGQTNVAGQPIRARSYGTTTADGVCALLACGVPTTDPRVQAALAWLQQHDTVAFVPGFPDDDEMISARDGLKFYYAAALANCLRQAPKDEWAGQRTALLEMLIAEQRLDGSWQNASLLMREDDPLVATALAVTALGMLTD